MTQKPAAKELGTSQSNLSKWEAGTQLPRSKNIGPIAEFTRLSASEVVDLITEQARLSAPDDDRAVARALVEMLRQELEGE